ncbi:MAG: hypothetical protein A2X49_05840 [Lentisphaerae bacterium GWF2_52_8]|nr:MAG: hypothetical protein A2X49_05840 [Lentisphaerae bacterium GWF2_52_8]
MESAKKFAKSAIKHYSDNEITGFIMLDIPEEAVACFEKWSKTKVTVYEFEPIFYLSKPQRFMHCSKECSELKKRHLKHCVDFDFTGYKAKKWDYPDGCVKICHAGFLEWIMPVCFKGKMLALLMAGLRYAPDAIPQSIPRYDTALPKLNIRFPQIKKTGGEEILFIMEGLRQLAARLTQWVESIQDNQNWQTTLKRDELILFLIKQNCRGNMSLASLAQSLHLSSSRTAHLVKELTGRNFKELANEYRLDYASKLLLYSGETIGQVAEACGYENVPHFHRSFKRRFHMTPLKYRRKTNPF